MAQARVAFLLGERQVLVLPRSNLAEKRVLALRTLLDFGTLLSAPIGTQRQAPTLVLVDIACEIHSQRDEPPISIYERDRSDQRLL